MVSTYFKNFSRTAAERKKKELVTIFKNNGLSITVKTNFKTANFLDINFDLVKQIHKTYKKTNDNSLHINKKNPIIHHQYCNNFQNQSQKEFQTFYQMNLSLTNQFLITNMP